MDACIDTPVTTNNECITKTNDNLQNSQIQSAKQSKVEKVSQVI